MLLLLQLAQILWIDFIDNETIVKAISEQVAGQKRCILFGRESALLTARYQ